MATEHYTRNNCETLLSVRNTSTLHHEVDKMMGNREFVYRSQGRYRLSQLYRKLTIDFDL